LPTRWPNKETVSDRSQGVKLETIQTLVKYWGTNYDWRKVEAKLSFLPQFVTNIDGIDIYFIHVRSRYPNALPLIITHGWPGSILELTKTIGPLTDPTVYGGSAEDAFDVVIPSMPGYGFSEKPKGAGWDPNRIARAWDVLMKRPGYKNYVAQGGDWGARTAVVMAALWPEQCKAIVSVSGYLVTYIKANQLPLLPKAELAWWYQYYFATERGKLDYSEKRYEFNKLIWTIASPQWNFVESIYSRTAATFNNPIMSASLFIITAGD